MSIFPAKSHSFFYFSKTSLTPILPPSFNWEKNWISFNWNHALHCRGVKMAPLRGGLVGKLLQLCRKSACSEKEQGQTHLWGPSVSFHWAGKQVNLPDCFGWELVTNICSLGSWTWTSLLPNFWRQVPSLCGKFSIPLVSQMTFSSRQVLLEQDPCSNIAYCCEASSAQRWLNKYSYKNLYVQGFLKM